MPLFGSSNWKRIVSGDIEIFLASLIGIHLRGLRTASFGISGPLWSVKTPIVYQLLISSASRA